MENNRNIFDILSLNANNQSDWGIINNKYNAVDIHKVIIDGDVFTGYGSMQFGWEKSYVEEPTRSDSGNIGNINNHSTFVVPHLILNFSIMSIDDFRTIMKKDLEKNEFVVECYDPIYNCKTVNKMYFTPLNLAKLYTLNKVRFNGEAWEEFIELAGVHDYTIELVGTLNSLDTVSVLYKVNAPDNAVPDFAIDGSEPDVYKGESLVLGTSTNIPDETFGNKYKFSKWNVSAQGGTDGNYINDTAYTINNQLVLYAQWEEIDIHTLTFNYGVADPTLNNEVSTYPVSIQVRNGASIGELTIPTTPTVVSAFDGATYTPYDFGEWWKIPKKVTKYNGSSDVSSLKVHSNDLYWTDKDSTIYWLYTNKGYFLSLYVDNVGYLQTYIQYDSPMNLPQLVQSGKIFDGWYTAEEFSKGDSGTKVTETNMPPHNLTLYARWK